MSDATKELKEAWACLRELGMVLPFHGDKVTVIKKFANKVRLEEARWWAEATAPHNPVGQANCPLCQRIKELEAVRP